MANPAERRRPGDFKQNAWLIVPIAVIVAFLLVLFGRQGEETLHDRNLADSRAAGSGLLVELTAGTPTPTEKAELQAAFRPAAQDLRQSVLNRLGQFRAAYKQLAPSVAVISVQQDPASRHFTRQLQAWLAELHLDFDLGDAPSSMLALIQSTGGTAKGLADLSLYSAEGDKVIARKLLIALSPALNGAVSMVFPKDASPNRFVLVVGAAPRFGPTGVAYFSSTSPE